MNVFGGQNCRCGDIIKCKMDIENSIKVCKIDIENYIKMCKRRF